LNLFTILNPTPLSAQEVASGIGADLRALTVLPDALSVMDLLVNHFFSLFPIGYGHFASPKGFLAVYPGPSQSILSMDRVGVNGFSFQRLVSPPGDQRFLIGSDQRKYLSIIILFMTSSPSLRLNKFLDFYLKFTHTLKVNCP
jgi:hypothetical protein